MKMFSFGTESFMELIGLCNNIHVSDRKKKKKKIGSSINTPVHSRLLLYLVKNNQLSLAMYLCYVKMFEQICNPRLFIKKLRVKI